MDGKLQWRDLGNGKSVWSGGTGGQTMTLGGFAASVFDSFDQKLTVTNVS